MPLRFLAVTFCLLLPVACGSETSLSRPDTNVTGESAPAPEPAADPNQVFAGLPVTATPDLQVRVLTAYVSRLPHGKPASWLVASLLRDRVVDNYSAVVVAAAYAQQLGWEWQTVMLDCQPGARFFLEVNTSDGRFLIDPYGGQMVTGGGVMDPMLPFPDAFQSGTLYHFDGTWPTVNYLDLVAAWKAAEPTRINDWAGAWSHACLASRYTPVQAMQIPVTVDLSAGNAVFGKIDNSPWDVDAAFAAPGESRSDHAFLGGFISPAGAVVFGHRLILNHTVPGVTYRYLLRLVEAAPGTLVAVSSQAALGGYRNLGNHVWALAITAATSQTEVTVGLDSLEAVSIDAFAVGSFSEGDRPW